METLLLSTCALITVILGFRGNSSRFLPILIISLSCVYALHNFNGFHSYVQTIQVFWPSAALVLIYTSVATYVEKQKTAEKHYQDMVRKLQNQAGELVDQCRNLEKSRHQLEKQYVYDDALIVKVHRSLKAFSGLSQKQIVSGIKDVLSQLLQISDCLYFPVYQGQIDVSEEYSHYTPALEKILQKGEISAKEQDDCPFILGRLLVSANGQGVGIILVRQMPFARLEFKSLRIFELICDLSALELEKAREFRFLEESSQIHGETGLYNAQFLKDNISRHIAMSRRYGSVSTVLSFSFKSIIEPSSQWTIRVSSRLKQAFRAVDLLFFNDRQKDRFHVILPMTSLEGAHVARDKFLHCLKQSYPGIEISCEVLELDSHLSNDEETEFFRRHGLCS